MPAEELKLDATGRIDWSGFRLGQNYRVHTMIGGQRYPREHIMGFLDFRKQGDFPGARTVSQWNARPFAGTQELYDSQIIAIWETAELTRYMNKILKGERRVY